MMLESSHKVAIAIGGGCVAFWIFNRWMQGGQCRSKAKLDGKTVLVTGANTGIGKYSAEDLCRRGAKVIILCRNESRAQAAMDDIKLKVPNADLEFEQLDLSSLQNIKACADRLNGKLEQVDILLNNAGLFCTQQKTADGFEMMFGTNHLGHFYLTNLLLPLLRKAGQSPSGCRVVTVSSMAHESCKEGMNWDDLNFDQSFSSMKAYCQSKLANILFSSELAERERDNGIRTYSLHPGVIKTDIGRDCHNVFGRLLFSIINFGLNFCKTIESGAQTSIYCCVDESVADHTGKYYSDCREKLPTAPAQDKESAKKLWEISAKMTNL
eukprot:TRINITY_DN2605_c1_g1_i1.p1 TRINITY_DN2605_c1_g1~~TRINITY_DN2605_c1_g1_i1.p1  ORF type:complete len:325 (+),score=52.48 TRINITY_DN2605_c1_g1_i1:31-1005(+)